MLIQLIAMDPAHQLVGALEAKGVPAVGSDAGAPAGVGKLGFFDVNHMGDRSLL